MLIALHGFLGLPSDWAPYRASIAMPLQARSVWNDLREVLARIRQQTGSDLGSIHAPTASVAFDVWTEMFIHWIERSAKANPLYQKPFLLGYSLGGRLAMHALAKRPELFQGAVLVSANPGTLVTAEARDLRYGSDEKWAEFFLKGEWVQTVSSWNQQSVLKSPPGSHPLLTRYEDDFDRVLLSEALTAWSLARQVDLRPKLTKSNLLLITGEFDQKFSDLTRAWLPMTASGASAYHVRHEVVANAGHRVPWDQPSAFQALIENWLGSVADF